MLVDTALPCVDEAAETEPLAELRLNDPEAEPDTVGKALDEARLPDAEAGRDEPEGTTPDEPEIGPTAPDDDGLAADVLTPEEAAPED